MPDIDGLPGFPITLSIGATEVAEIEDATPPRWSAAEISWTPISGTYAGKERSVAGGEKFGDTTLKITYDKDQSVTLRALRKVSSEITVTYPDLSTDVFTGFISEMGEDQLSAGNRMTTTVKIKRTTDSVFTAAADGQLFAEFDLALAAGAGSIDLRALPDPIRGTIDGNGKKVTKIVLLNKATNANNMTITVGAVNGYELAGASMNVVLSPGQTFTFLGDNDTPTIAAADKTLDVAGTGTQVLHVQVTMA